MLRPLTVAAAEDDGLEVYVTQRGAKFVQLHQRLPSIFRQYLYSGWETTFNSIPGTQFARDYWWLPIAICVLYISAIVIGKHYMATRERMDLRYKLAAWNGVLCFFSFAGALRTVPDLLWRLGSGSVKSTICVDPAATWGAGATGLWVQLFIFSKIPELVDTFFIVARKRPLIFLHPYHHVTVLLYCWHSYATEASQALYFVAMNYSVHAIMYGYYCLMALKIPSGVPPVLITAAQLSQMVVGVAVQGFASYSYLTAPETCHINGANIFWGGLMYASYFGLFTKFALERYLKKPEKVA